MVRWLASVIRSFHASTGGSPIVPGLLWCAGHVLLFVLLRAIVRGISGPWLGLMVLPVGIVSITLVLLAALVVDGLAGRPVPGGIAMAMLVEAGLIALMTWHLATRPVASTSTPRGSLFRLPYVASFLVRPLVVSSLVLLLLVQAGGAPEPWVAVAVVVGSLLAEQCITWILVQAYRAHGEVAPELSEADPYLDQIDVVVVDRGELVDQAAVFGFLLPGAVVVVQRWVANAVLDPTTPDHGVARAILCHEGAHVRGRHAQWRAALVGGTVFLIMAAVRGASPWVAPALVVGAGLATYIAATRVFEAAADRRVEAVFGEAMLRRMRDDVRVRGR
jgi:Zn-dependent protease with chaperone function